MTDAESKRMLAAYGVHLKKGSQGKVKFMDPAEWMAHWLHKQAIQAVKDRVFASLGRLEA